MADPRPLVAHYMGFGDPWLRSTSWRLAAGTVPADAHDVAALSGKTHTLAAPALPAGHQLVGYRVEISTVGVITGDPGGLVGLAYGLHVDATDVTTGGQIASPTVVGGGEPDPNTGNPPVAGVAGVAAAGAYAAGNPIVLSYGAPVTAPQIRVYTSAPAVITGTVDLTGGGITYGPGGTFDGATITVSSDTRGPAPLILFQPANAAELVQLIEDAIGADAGHATMTGAHHLVIYSYTRTPTSSITVAAGAGAAALGFAGGASATDGTPALSAVTALDATIRVITAPIVDVTA